MQVQLILCLRSLERESEFSPQHDKTFVYLSCSSYIENNLRKELTSRSNNLEVILILSGIFLSGHDRKNTGTISRIISEMSRYLLECKSPASIPHSWNPVFNHINKEVFYTTQVPSVGAILVFQFVFFFRENVCQKKYNIEKRWEKEKEALRGRGGWFESVKGVWGYWRWRWATGRWAEEGVGQDQ